MFSFQASRGAYTNSIGQRTLSPEETDQSTSAAHTATSNTSKKTSTARQIGSYDNYQYNPYVAAAAAQYNEGHVNVVQATMDASGSADLNVKLDLHVLLEKLNMIPLIEQALTVLNAKLDQSMNQNPTNGVAQMILQLEGQLAARLDDQDNKIRALLECCQQTAAKLAAFEQQLAQTQQLVQSVQSTGFSQITQCNLSPIEGQISGLGSTLASLADMLRRMSAQLDLSALLKSISKNLGLSEQALAILRQIGQPGYLCPVKSQATKTEIQMFQQLGSVLTILQGLPQTIISGWEASHKSTSQIMPYLVKLQQWMEVTSGQVAGVQGSLTANTADIKRYFTESQKSLFAVKKIVTETTEVVQNSAAAATAAVASASRSLCRRGRKVDLED